MGTLFLLGQRKLGSVMTLQGSQKPAVLRRGTDGELPQDCPPLLHGVMVRLFVGGLAEDVTSEQLAQRFQFFGRVSSCDVLQPKANNTNIPPTSSCRGFGYVQLEIEDDAALRKCLTAVS